MFAEDGDVERADVAIGHDGRSRVSIQADSGCNSSSGGTISACCS